MSLYSELKRRNVFRVAGAYAALAWLIIQIAETLMPLFGFGAAAVRNVAIVLAAGFVPAIVVSWLFELTPAGFVRDAQADHDSPGHRAMGKRLDRAFLIVLALAVSYFAVDKFVLDPARDREREQLIAEQARAAGRSEAGRNAREELPPMIAVLPFAASGDTADSEFLATGIHDDLLTQLAQLQSLRVISRTSVLDYADGPRNIPMIGEALGADAILEGMVQSAGDRIRINAQLIDVDTDEHLWAQTYDRGLSASNIFDVQSEIAHAIAGALNTTLTEQDALQLRVLPTDNMAAYRAYHRAVNLFNEHRDVQAEIEAALQEAVRLDPAFTRAWAEITGFYARLNVNRENVDAIRAAEDALQRIEELAPGSADHLLAQTFYAYHVLKDYDLALRLLAQAVVRRPSDLRLLELRSFIERRNGDYPAMIETIREARRLDPREEDWTRRLVQMQIMLHRYDAARAELEQTGIGGYFADLWRVMLDAEDGLDPRQLEKGFLAVHRKYAPESSASILWSAHIVARNYPAALDLLADFPPPGQGQFFGMFLYDYRLGFELLPRWFLGEHEKVAELVARSRAMIAEAVADDRLQGLGQPMLSNAMLAAIEGRTEETEAQIRLWYAATQRDPLARFFVRELACRALGMAGSASAAVDCLREGFVEPGFVIPFIEPALPYYDAIRDDPGFVTLLGELKDQGERNVE